MVKEAEEVALEPLQGCTLSAQSEAAAASVQGYTVGKQAEAKATAKVEGYTTGI
jgi:hypothetical protein